MKPYSRFEYLLQWNYGAQEIVQEINNQLKETGRAKYEFADLYTLERNIWIFGWYEPDWKVEFSGLKVSIH